MLCIRVICVYILYLIWWLWWYIFNSIRIFDIYIYIYIIYTSYIYILFIYIYIIYVYHIFTWYRWLKNTCVHIYKYTYLDMYVYIYIHIHPCIIHWTCLKARKTSNNSRSDANLVESYGLRLRMLGMQDGPRKLKLELKNTMFGWN